ncbi:hypothetical protein [Paracoccus sp. TOH]|uniref:hypothetical protein n=1 Tax=Paracoccus sp. TOH TaxID=1263728 RepID=UPI0025B182B7|nr:hypothetical protein [Paracoccus sp. TOH]WJS87219.1 hypothetical protein NBE95_20280 [Paracoccus sp. TOH]
MKTAKAKAATGILLPTMGIVSASMLALAALLAMLPGLGLAQEPAEDYPQGWEWNSVSTQDWPSCDQKCLLDTINAARTVVMFHTKGELRQDEAEALVGAIRRGARVEIYVGKTNNLSDEVIWMADDIYQKWAATADDTETRMIGMGGCVMGKSDHPSFVVADPFAWGANEAPALVVNGKKTDKRDVAAAASVVVETEDFIQCKLKS